MKSLRELIRENSAVVNFGVRRHVAAFKSADMSAHSKLLSGDHQPAGALAYWAQETTWASAGVSERYTVFAREPSRLAVASESPVLILIVVAAGRYGHEWHTRFYAGMSESQTVTLPSEKISDAD